MRRHRLLIIIVLLAVGIVLVGAAGFVLGDLRSVKGISIKQPSPHQLAEAMKGDHFYSDYRRSALLISGVVASVGQWGGHLLVALKSDSSYDVLCEFAAATVAPHPGEV